MKRPAAPKKKDSYNISAGIMEEDENPIEIVCGGLRRQGSDTHAPQANHAAQKDLRKETPEEARRAQSSLSQGGSRAVRGWLNDR